MDKTLTKVIKNAGGGKPCLLVAGATLAILAPFQAAQAVTVNVGTGTVTGHFDNAITLPGSVYTGNGTDTIEWGTPVDGSFTNQLSFIPSDFTDQPKGQDFVAGRLYYRNGTIFLGTRIDGVDLIINTTSSDPDFTQTLPLKITIVNTPNVADPIASADFIYFTDFPDRGSFRVLEGEDTDVEVITQFNSLDLVGFGAVGDPSKGFLSPSVGPDPFPAVPEPSSILGLLALGLLGMGSVFNKQRK
ncbi:MAG: choice-of-anchor K domain-containing protein [Microcystis sp. LE17-20A]|jgi:hypothetical protein|uniref:choice-of-anchor K domain-containing protein n=1 Tax=unclassified Microcystis TaxID=2643300 RepID=UPI0022BB8650|nr:MULTISPECIES: choice-of-anchor K domain-containing protein [unclassified Microcystis]MCZ8037783.1 choice-of-anchor K domain-containing protein [Microcystis sp. LE17-20A]MCZ8210935.1 choice-of-anchor K domain-containing protein [Microcystis sp. LE19-8.1F]